VFVSAAAGFIPKEKPAAAKKIAMTA